VYLAPEVLNSCIYSEASDMWATGVILFVMFKGKFPGQKYLAMQVKEIDPTTGSDLVSGLLNEDPSVRMSAAQAAKHPWTTSNCTESKSMTPEEDLQAVTSSFLDFYKSDKLLKAALTALASQTCGQQIFSLRDSFNLMDTDGNGVITKEELLAAFEEAPPPGITNVTEWVQDIFDELDSDGSGELEFTEWEAAAMRSFTSISEEAMRAAFHVLDTDHSGTISVQELSRVMPMVSEVELVAAIAQADLNGDGVIDFFEFSTMLTKAVGQANPLVNQP